MSLIWIIAAGLAIILGGLLIASFTPAIFPAQGSTQAQQVDTLFRFMLAIGGAIFLLVNGVLLYSVIRFRARKGDNSDGPPIHGNTTLEFTWTVIPAVIVLILTIYSFQVWTSIRAPQPNEQTVNVVGQRFVWSFNYPITDKTLPQGVTMDQLPQAAKDAVTSGKALFTSSQLGTWVNQPVHAFLDTVDVNHAFWIPGMRIKQDLLAGRETDVRFTPVEAGTYRIECAELCGPGHGTMAGSLGGPDNTTLMGSWLVVYPDEQTYLREFYDPQAAAVLFPPTDPALLGQQVIGNYACKGCHTLTSQGWAGTIGPHLDGIGSRAGNRIPGMAAEDYIHDSLRNPAHFIVPGFTNDMTPFSNQNPPPGGATYMSDEDLNAITAFLLTQK